MLTDTEIKFLSHIHCVTDVNIWFSKCLTSSPYRIWSDLRESCTKDLNVRLH